MNEHATSGNQSMKHIRALEQQELAVALATALMMIDGIR